MVNPRKEMEQEVLRIQGQASTLDVGSEEFLNAMKAANQAAEAATKMKKVDANAMIPACGSVVMLIVYYLMTETRIMDTRPIQFVKSLFKR